MSLDTRPRRGSRACERAWSDFKPKKLLGCFGGLTPGPGLPIGSAIGQISSAQIASTNQLLGTFNPALTWVVNGGAAISAESSDQWDAGFIPARLTSNNGAADFISQAIPTALPATQYAVSGQFAYDADEATPSVAVRMAVNWTGGVARQDSIDFNPATGTLIAVSAGVTAPSIVIFSTIMNGVRTNALAVSFVTPATPAGTNNATFRIFPNINAGVGTVEAGGFQVEVGTVASAFISTNSSVTADRSIGTIPRLVIDRSEAVTFNPALPATYVQISDNGRTFGINATGVFNVPPGLMNGEWFNLYIRGGTVTVTGINGAAFSVPGVIGSPTSFVVPYDGVATSAGLYNVQGIRLVWGGPAFAVWYVYSIAETHGVRQFTANGTFTTGNGMTQLWADAAAGGGGGGGCAAVNSAAGGGGGGQAIKDNQFTVAPSTAISITIGTGGTGGAAGNNNGVAGNNTIIGALATLTGGALGTGSASGATAAGGAAGGANAQAGDAGQLIAGTLALGGEGGFSLFGMAESNPFATGAGSQAGRAGVAFGAGGGGGSSSTTGAAAAGGAGTGGFVTFVW